MNTTHTKIVALASSLLLFATACSKPDAGTEPVVAPAAAPQAAEEKTEAYEPGKMIDWYEGSVDEAFAEARETDKPVYLYWGAVWCPPCHAISATVFTRPEFIERSKLFIPVYLDGDLQDAQAYGEKFGVRGYPTMIVFNSAGEELTRLPSGVDIQAYVNILDLTLGDVSSAAELVANIMGGDANELAPQDCTLLAYHSWGQDLTTLKDLDAAATFRKLHDACAGKQKAERSRLFFLWLDEALSSGDDEELQMSAAEQKATLEELQMILSDYDLAKTNIFAVTNAAAYAEALTEDGSEAREQFRQQAYALFDRIQADEDVYLRERIYMLRAKADFERLPDEEAELSEALKAEIREMVEYADASTPSVYERQPIINALGNVLRNAEMYDVARPLLLAELERSKQPYYFMTGLAGIAEAEGNVDEAVDWYRKGWEASKGPATRFQWGYYYLAGLIELQPENTQLIHDTTVTLVTELQAQGGFFQRPKAQLASIENYLTEWGVDNAEALSNIRSSVLAVCAESGAAEESRATCEAFLETA